MKKLLSTLFALALCISVSATAKEAIVYQTFADNVQVIDVRSDEEFKTGHLPKALHIPHTTILEGNGFADLDKSKPVVLYCRSGGRAQRAKDYLEAQGFTDVKNMGGISDLIISAKKEDE